MKKFLILTGLLAFFFSTHAQNDHDANGVFEVEPWVQNTADREYVHYADTGDVLHTIPTPGGKCNALTWDGSALWTSDLITRTIYRVSPDDGSVLSSFPYPSEFDYCEGLAWDGTYLLACGWESSNGYGSKIFTLDPEDGAIIESFSYPLEEPWPHGITYDGQYIWANEFNTNSLDKLDRETGEIIHSVPAPGEKSVGVTWDGKYLWSDNYEEWAIYQIDPADGSIITSFPAPTYNPRGMAFDGHRLWVISWNNETIYQLDAGPAAVPEYSRSDLSIFPNPAYDRITVINFNTPVSRKVLLVDRTGKAVLSGFIPKGEDRRVISLDGFSPGLYTILLEDGNRDFSSAKVLVVK